MVAYTSSSGAVRRTAFHCRRSPVDFELQATLAPRLPCAALRIWLWGGIISFVVFYDTKFDKQRQTRQIYPITSS